MYFPHSEQKRLIENLENELICPANHGLNLVYSQIENYMKQNLPNSIQQGFVKDLKEPFFSLVAKNQQAITTIAIDFPIYFQSHSENKKTLMICAMDSLPPIPTSTFWNDRNVNFKENIGFWAPFSLIENWSKPAGSMKTNLPFFETLLSQFNIYITDIYKVFFRLEIENGYINSNSIPAYTQLRDAKGINIHGKILAKEVDIIRPDAIITLGNAARNALLEINTEFNFPKQNPIGWKDDLQHYLWKNETKIIASPHISGAANGAKSSILNNPKYQHICGKYQNERLAKIAIQQLLAK
jgi:hypothetical protein